MSHAPPPLPKPGSAATKQLWEETKRALDLPRTVLVLEGALDRKSLEEILQRLVRGGSTVRPGQMPRAELVGHLAEGYHQSVEAAYAMMKELDRSCHKERNIVASIDEASIDERLATYRAIDFRRERARIIWALLRDGREAHKKAADKVLLDAFAQIQKAADAHAAAEGAPSPAGLGDLKERLTSYEEAIVEQQKELQRAVGQRESVERERSELMVRVGQRERALREEEELRRGVEDELKRAKSDLATAKGALEESQPARLTAALEELAVAKEKIRALEGRAERASSLADVEAKLEASERALESEKRHRAKDRAEHAEQTRLFDVREAAAFERMAALREELKAARRALAGEAPLESDAAGAGEGGAKARERVGVFVDAANLSASAKRDFGSKLDYRALLAEVLDGRKKTAAVAFVVKDGEERAYTGFVTSLRDGGYEIREKKPKTRGDGSRKADWDMGIAMEILDLEQSLDVVVLCSGDGDFVPLVLRLKRAGKRVEVAAFRASTDDSLIRAADAFVPLDGRFRMST